MGLCVVSVAGQPALSAFPFVSRILELPFREPVETLLRGGSVHSSPALQLDYNGAANGRYATITLSSQGAASRVLLEVEAYVPPPKRADPRPALPMMAWCEPVGSYERWELFNCRVLNVMPFPV